MHTWQFTPTAYGNTTVLSTYHFGMVLLGCVVYDVHTPLDVVRVMCLKSCINGIFAPPSLVRHRLLKTRYSMHCATIQSTALLLCTPSGPLLGIARKRCWLKSDAAEGRTMSLIPSSSRREAHVVLGNPPHFWCTTMSCRSNLLMMLRGLCRLCCADQRIRRFAPYGTTTS